MTATQGAEVDAPYFLKFSVYENLPGINIADLFAGSFPDNPDQVHYLSSFDTRSVFSDNSLDNYGASIEGWITPPETQSSGWQILFRIPDLQRGIRGRLRPSGLAQSG
ncbi:MAG: hypothetical protein EBU26_09755 [Verrucomicrobia bacterium]|nr:hypothetical protein [Verrucomicrobiota bacterium]